MEVTGKVVITAEEGQTSSEQFFCGPCQRVAVRMNAVGMCRECKENMCDTCFRHHLKAKVCRNHLLVEIDKRPTDIPQAKDDFVEICKKHVNEAIKFYCRKHEAVGCPDCIKFEHGNCKPEFIKDVAKKEETIKQMCDKLASIKQKSDKTLAKNEREIDELNEAALKASKQFRLDLDKYLDKAEAVIRSHIEKLTNENFKQHIQLEQDVRLLIKEVEEVKSKLSRNPVSKTVHFIHAVTCKPKIENIKKMYDQIKQRDSFKKFEFTRSEKLAELLKSSPLLGKCVYSERQTSNFTVGTRVQRGPDWRYMNQDGRGAGTVTGFTYDGRAEVTWIQEDTELTE